MTSQEPKQTRADGQVTGLAGELFVAAELLKRNIQVSITFGNAKAIDLLAYNPATKRQFSIQVKAVRKRNVFPISHSNVDAEHIYVFVVLNKPGESVDYFVVPGAVLKAQPERFVARWFQDPKFPGISWKTLKDQGFEDKWAVFHEVAPTGVSVGEPKQ